MIHLVFIFLHIYKNALFTQELFTKQRCEKEIKDLIVQQQLKKNELLYLQNPETIVAFAQENFGLAFINLNQIRHIP